MTALGVSILSLFVGIDVGGTTSTIAIGSEDRRLLLVSDQFATRMFDGPVATLSDIIRGVSDQLSHINATIDDIHTVTIATPGPATMDGVLMPSPNLREDLWAHYPIRAELEKRFQSIAHAVRVSYLGDGQAAALGEFVVRSGRVSARDCASFAGDASALDRSLRSLFFVSVGTGLGGGEVRDGAVVRGCQGRAGHAGHLLLPDHAFRYSHDRQLKVGNAFMTAESAVSLTSLTHQLAHRLTLPTWKEHPLNQLTGTAKDRAKQLRRYAADGDSLALELFDDQAKSLGLVMLMVNYVGDFDCLVIGGGVCDLAPPIRDRYRQNVEASYLAHCLDGFRDHFQIAFSACGDSASVIGALAHAYET